MEHWKTSKIQHKNKQIFIYFPDHHNGAYDLSHNNAKQSHTSPVTEALNTHTHTRSHTQAHTTTDENFERTLPLHWAPLKSFKSPPKKLHKLFHAICLYDRDVCA